MESYNSQYHQILNSTTIDELHKALKSKLTERRSDNSFSEGQEYLKQIPELIQKLHDQDIQRTSGGLKHLRIAKQAAESALFFKQLAVGKTDSAEGIELGKKFLHEIDSQNVLSFEMERQYEDLRSQYNDALKQHLRFGKPIDDNSFRALRYCQTLGHILNIDLPNVNQIENSFLPPLNVGLNEKKEYNAAAYILNREVEKRALIEYVENLQELSSEDSLLINEKDNSGIKNDLNIYQSMIEHDYPNLSENEIKFFLKVLTVNAGFLGFELSPEQLNFQKPFPIFGSSVGPEKSKTYLPDQNPDEMGLIFYQRLLRCDLFTQYFKLSSLCRNLKPGSPAYAPLGEYTKNPTKYDLIVKEKNEIEILTNRIFFFKRPSIENWEKALGELQAINDDYHFLPLSRNQELGQTPWFFTSDPKNLKAFANSVEKRITNYEFAKKLIDKDPTAHKQLLKMSENKKKEIDVIYQRYKADPQKLLDVTKEWRSFHFSVHYAATDTSKHQNVEWNDFFNRWAPGL